MANAFDQFDAATPTEPSNSFDQFDGAAPAPKAADPSEGGSTLKIQPGAMLGIPGTVDTHIPTGQGVDRFLSGAGKGLSDTAGGVHQLALHIGNHLGLVSDEDVAKNQADIDEAHKYDKPLMDTTAGKVGDIVGTAAPAALAPGTGVVGGAMAGAGLGAAQPVPTGESRVQNSLLGAAGGAAGGLVGKVVKGLGGFGIPMDRQAAVDTLTAEGIPTSVAQKTGSKAAQSVERASAMISDAHNEFMAQFQPKFNQSVLRRIGVDDPAVTKASPDVVSGARSRITGVMDDVAKNGVKVDDGMLHGLGEVEDGARLQLPDADIGPIRAHISDILSNAAKNDGTLDGTAYQKIRSSLGDLASDPRYAPFTHDMQEVLDDALSRQNPEDAARLATARKQYRALNYQIKPAVDSDGNVSVNKLMSTLMNKSNRNQSFYGDGDQSLVNLAKAAKKIIPDTLGNSGTPERMLGPLTVMEGLRQEGGLFKTAVKAALAVQGGAAAGRAMRSQGLAGKIAATGVPGIGAAAPAINDVAPALGYGTAESKERDADIERASGGKVDHEALVSRLINKWKQAKKATNKSTEVLLKVPDDAIAKALDVAGRAV